jgi:GNAT superfamily N-acetyltransferase
VRYVPRLERAQILEAARQNHPFWGAGRTRAEHAAHTLRQLEAAGPELLRYVGLVDARGRLLGAIKRFSLLFHDGGDPGPAGHEGGALLRAVGIGAVFTNPAARGRGVASTLLGAVLDEARDLGYAAALLYSDIDPAFYARLGFVALPARDWTIDPAALPVQGALEVRRARDKDLGRLLGWYEEAWEREHPSFLRPARSPAIWRFFRFRNRIGAEWIVRYRGRDAGYLIAAPDDPRRELPDPREPRLFWVDEAALPGVPRERLWATVRALAEKARALHVRGWIGPGGMPEGAVRVVRPSSVPMVAPLAPGLHVRPRRTWADSFQHF